MIEPVAISLNVEWERQDLICFASLGWNKFNILSAE